MCGGACQESHLCCVRLLHDQLHLPNNCGLDLGRRLARQHLRCWIHGFRGIRRLGPRIKHLNINYWNPALEGMLPKKPKYSVFRCLVRPLQVLSISQEASAASLARSSLAPGRDASRIPRSSSTTTSRWDLLALVANSRRHIVVTCMCTYVCTHRHILHYTTFFRTTSHKHASCMPHEQC